MRPDYDFCLLQTQVFEGEQRVSDLTDVEHTSKIYILAPENLVSLLFSKISHLTAKP